MKRISTRRITVLLLTGMLSAGLVACREEEPQQQVFEEEELGIGQEEDVQDEFGSDSSFEDEEYLENFESEPLGENDLEEGFEDDQSIDAPLEEEEPLEAGETP